MACTLKYKKALSNAEYDFIKNANITKDKIITDFVKYEKYKKEYTEQLESFFPEIKSFGEITKIEKKFDEDLKEGVEDAFKMFPELKNIGTMSQYSQYIKSIFPKSVIGDILYRKGSLTPDTGLLFASPDKDYFTNDIRKTHMLLFNMQNPEIITNIYNGKIHQIETISGDIDSFIVDNQDIEVDPSKFGDRMEVAIKSKNTSQYHSLGSQEDFEGFQKFVKNNISDFETNKIIFNKKVFDYIDNKRKDLNIYDSKLSTYAYFTNDEDVNFKLLEAEKTEEKLNWHKVLQESDFKFFEKEINNKEKNIYILFGNKEKNITVDEVLTNIQNNYQGLNESTLKLLEKSKNLMNKSGAKVSFVEKLENNSTLMQWSSGINTIQINKDSLESESPETMIQAFLHEMVHSQTGKALLSPFTFEEKEFKKLIESNYKRLNKNDFYGFTNPMEFVAELYSNDIFQNEVKTQYKSFWQNFIDAVRRMFNLPKTNKFDQLMKEITNIIESDQRNFKGIYGSTEIFQSRKDKIETVEDKLNRTLNKAKDNLDQLLKRSKTYRKHNQDKGGKFTKHIKQLISEIEKVDKVNQWKGISVYVKSMNTTVSQLLTRVENEDLSKGNGLEMIELYKSYLSSYDLIDDVRNLITSLEEDKIEEVGEEDILEIKQNITEASGKRALLESEFNAKLKKILKNELLDIKYLPQVEADWKNKLSKEYDERGIRNISKPEWIVEQMQTSYKDQIEEDMQKYLNNLLDGIGNDISSAAVTFLDGINNNSRLVQITMQLLTESREKIISKTREFDFELKELFEKFNKEKGNKKLSQIYKNILEYDSSGKAYLKGEYSLKYREEYIRQRNLKQAVFEKYGKKSPEFKKAIKQLTKWVTDNHDISGFKMEPISKWKNDLNTLSEIEKETLNKFKNIIESSSKETLGKQSLLKVFKKINYYSLPSITNSNLERILENNYKGVVKDVKQDLFNIRPDDIGFEERKLDSKGDPVNFLKIHYRGKIEPSQQSLDLFTIFRLERINGFNYSEKQNIQLKVEAIKNVAKNKEYSLKQKGSNIPILNMFATREKTATFSGEKSNEYKMLTNLIEKNLYDLFHVNYGTLAGADVNKVVSTANKWTASVGLSLNSFSAAANLLNGQAQIFLEKVGGNHLSKGALRKAHKIYNSDLPNIFSDYGKPIKESYVNQINQMFDTFGGFTVQQQEFIKNTVAKTALDFNSLQFMHSGGEHYLQSIMVMASLDSIKVMNANNKYINKKGEVVSYDKAASILDMLEKNEKGFVELDEKVVFSDKNTLTSIKEGGKEKILLFVKKKIFDTMGNYDSNLQPEAYRHWWGKLILMFRRYLIPQGYNRFRGITSSFKKYEDLTEDEQYFSASLQNYEEGYYVSTLRFLRNGVLPALKQLKYEILSQNWKELTIDQKANIKKSVTELAITGAVLPLIGMLAAAVADGDDDEYLWTIAFLSRRLESELAQFRDPREAYKITNSPIPSLRIIEQSMDVIESTVNPWSWDDKFKSGKRKGELKIIRNYEKLIPVVSRMDTTAEELYNGINSTWGK